MGGNTTHTTHTSHITHTTHTTHTTCTTQQLTLVTWSGLLHHTVLYINPAAPCTLRCCASAKSTCLIFYWYHHLFWIWPSRPLLLNIFRPLPEGGLFSFHCFVVLFLLFLLFLVLRFEKVFPQAQISPLFRWFIGSIGGVNNFCLQSQECRLAGLVYFCFRIIWKNSMLQMSVQFHELWAVWYQELCTVH